MFEHARTEDVRRRAKKRKMSHLMLAGRNLISRQLHEVKLSYRVVLFACMKFTSPLCLPSSTLGCPLYRVKLGDI